jgi:hypothetical protein
MHALIGRTLTRAASLALLAAVGIGCGEHPGGGRIEVTYRQVDPEKAKDPLHYAGPASTAWCPGAGRLEVTSINEDMGFGLVIYPVDSLVAGAYRAFDPGIDSVRRPGAAGVARWFNEQRVTGLQSDSGMLKLTRNGDAFDASFGFRLRAIDGSDTTRLTGRAVGLRPGPCTVDSLPGTAPKQ